MGDTQEHLATGYPLHDNDSAVDTYVEVAQRPPEQPLFGRRIPEWALQCRPDLPYLHLGDILDLSCRVEARRIAEVFGASRNAGAILPGNHDGLMFGIYGYDVFAAVLDPNAQRWNRACQRGAAPEDVAHKTAHEALTKREFIAGYIAALAHGRPAKPGLATPSSKGDQRISWRSPDPNGYLSGIEARVRDGSVYAASFLAQRLKLPRAKGATRDVIIIGLDTNQAGVLANSWDTLTGKSPGSMGHIHLDQFQAIDKWLEESIRRGDIVIFAGHHNWQALGIETRVLLRARMARLQHPLIYLSAHTHSGFWAVDRTLSPRPLLELNISSLSDWPIAYRLVSFAYDESAQRLQVRGELMPHGNKPIRNYADLMADWESETCARTGLPHKLIKGFDLAEVRRQRQARGNLIEWLVSGVPNCESCEQILYEHANTYQNAMLKTLLQGVAATKVADLKLPEFKPPPLCGALSFEDCSLKLLAETPKDFQGQQLMFQRKAALVAAINDYLDRIDEPRAKAYMTCRAVQAAKVDFDATDEARTENRSEAKRRAEHFFQIEASVGMK